MAAVQTGLRAAGRRADRHVCNQKHDRAEPWRHGSTACRRDGEIQRQPRTGERPGIQSTDLLQLQGKTLELGNGLAVKATPLRDKNLKVWLYDAKLPEQRKFKSLDYFPYDPKGRITAAFRRNEKPVAVSYLDSREQAGTMYEVGVIDAVIDGKPQKLKTFSYRNDWNDIDALLLLLRDRTSGKTTYGGGRVVEIAIPKGAPPATVTFDLNMAYSFLCAHSEFYNCPLVLTNRLDADLTYGEKYPPQMTGG